MKTIVFSNMQIEAEVENSQTILEIAQAHQVPISSSCGGMGTCGTCLVRVITGLSTLGPRNEIEAEMAVERGFPDDERLACQNECSANLDVIVLYPNDKS